MCARRVQQCTHSRTLLHVIYIIRYRGEHFTHVVLSVHSTIIYLASAQQSSTLSHIIIMSYMRKSAELLHGSRLVVRTATTKVGGLGFDPSGYSCIFLSVCFYPPVAYHQFLTSVVVNQYHS